MGVVFRASGLHDAMYLVPVMLSVAAVLLAVASTTFQADHRAMQRGMAD